MKDTSFRSEASRPGARGAGVAVRGLAVAVLLLAGLAHAARPYRGGAVATAYPPASAAALEMLEKGGNATDAAVAAAFVAGVVGPYHSGIGGGGFALVHDGKSGETQVLDFREVAPKAATRDMYLKDGKVVPGLSTDGPLAVAVPGAVAGYLEILKKHGKLPPSVVLAPAIAAALGAGYGLPVRQRASTAPVPAIASTPVSPHVARVPQDASAAKALKLYENGEKAQALAMLDVLVKKGNADAYGLYGWMTLMGEGLAKKPGQGAPTAQERQAWHADAKPWITRALAKNDSYALAAKGVMLAEGWQEQRNMPRALELLKQAAQKGNTEAMHLLGLYNMMGKSTPVNHKEARKWFTMAADKGSAGDIYNLGLMDWEGAGLKRPDRASAMQRWKIAASMGEERAIKAVAQGKP